MAEPFRTLLIAGDGPAAQAVEAQLDALGERVTRCSMALDGLRAARETRFDMVVLDGALGPDATLSVCNDLRAMPVNGQGLLVLVNGEEKDLPGLIDAGVDELLPTHAAPDYLWARVRALIRRARRRAARAGVEATIRDTEARVRAVLDTAQDGIVTINEHGVIVGFNPAAERIFGFPAANVIGRSVAMLLPEPYHSGHEERITRYLATDIRGIIGQVRQLRGRHRDGTEFPLELVVGEATVSGRRLFTGVVRDTSERTAAEARIRLNNRLLKAVSDAQSRFIAKSGAGEVFQGLLDELVGLTTSHWGMLAAIDAPDGRLPRVAPHAVTGVNAGPEGHARMELFIQNSPLYKAFDTGSMVLPEKGERIPEGVLPHGAPQMERMAVLPLTSGGETVGLAVLGDRKKGYDAELLDPMEPLLFTAASLFSALRAEGDRVQARRALEKSHEDLQAVLNGLRIGTVITDAAGRVTFISDSAREMCPRGASPVGRLLEECLPFTPADRERVLSTAALPAPERTKVAVHLPAGAGRLERWLEVDVADDPRDPQRRIYLMYDVTDLHGLRQMLSEKASFHNMVGNSKPMRVLFQQIQEVAQVDWTVLVEGETGTGKELAARAIHTASPRADRPFIAVNAAGLTDSVLASQLFGHKRGAFTGAVTDHKGFFEAAEGGTIFLDEIGDIPMGVQTSLLRVLQEREITRLGESVPRKVNVRVVAATNRNLSHEVEKGAFRADLLYRLRVARVPLPPLRERREDIPLLAAATLAKSRASSGKDVTAISPDAMRVLSAYHWPGNVRELVHAVEFAVIQARTDTIQIADLPPEIHTPTSTVMDTRFSRDLPAPPAETRFAAGREALHSPFPVPDTPSSLGAPSGAAHSVAAGARAGLSEDEEREHIAAALEAHGHNRQKAAKALGIGRATLYRRMEALGIPTRK